VFENQTVLASEWNSLEVAKLLVAVLTPVAVVLLGLYVRSVSRRIEDAQWSSRRVLDWRLDLYKTMAPKLNDLYCFFMLVGDFREVKPTDALARKRALDKDFHVNRFLFSDEFGLYYYEFMAASFATWQGFGVAARLRSSLASQQSERSEWDATWDQMFTPEADSSTQEEFEQRYETLMRRFAAEVGGLPPSGAAKANSAVS